MEVMVNKTIIITIIFILLIIAGAVAISNYNFKQVAPTLITYEPLAVLGLSCQQFYIYNSEIPTTMCMQTCKTYNHVYYSAACDARDNLICSCTP